MKQEIHKKYRVPRKKKKQIPTGSYCYGPVSKYIVPEDGSTPYFKVKYCPFFGRTKSDDGYWVSKCEITKIDDDLCLNDGCKVCEIKMGR